MQTPHPSPPSLPPGFQLDGYRIQRQLSQGGFSIVYLATDDGGKSVAIKEYMPVGLTRRSADSPAPIVDAEHLAAFNMGMKWFFDEAQVLAGIDHPNVVHVTNCFRAHGTVYLVMRYENGCTLREHVRQLAEAGTGISEKFLRNVFSSLLSGLREIHARKLLHLDIKPANIYLRSVLRVNDLSGFVARHLSGCHSHLEEVADETDGVVTGDPEDEIRRSVFRVERRATDPSGSGAVIRDGRAQFPSLRSAV